MKAMSIHFFFFFADNPSWFLRLHIIPERVTKKNMKTIVW